MGFEFLLRAFWVFVTFSSYSNSFHSTFFDNYNSQVKKLANLHWKLLGRKINSALFSKYSFGHRRNMHAKASTCNTFLKQFHLCHKCNKYNCLPWKMLNHAGNRYNTHRKQLCHPPDTVIQLYHPLLYLFCILLIRSGLRSNYAVAKQSKQSRILKLNEDLRAMCSVLFDFVSI